MGEIWHCGELAAKVKNEAKELIGKTGSKTLEIISVGHDHASEVYMRGKVRDCEEVGAVCLRTKFDESASTRDIIAAIELSCADGIIVQLPVPDHIDESAIIDAIPENKDVDGFCPTSLGEMMLGRDGMLPCTPAGIMRILEEHGVELRGKKVVIIGRSNIVGKPLANLMMNAGATVSVCNSSTPNLSEYTRMSDIIVSAAGCAGLLKADMVGEDAIVIDVAMNRDEAGNLCGDCASDVSSKAKAVTPVPGGVGLMTRAMLMLNLARVEN